MDPLKFMTTTNADARATMLEIAAAQEELRRRDAKYLVAQFVKTFTKGG